MIDNPSQAVFAYNHLESYVQSVLGWASTYAKGGFSVTPVTVDDAPSCLPGVGVASSDVAAAAITYAEAQLGKPYQWGGTGPDAFDCSGLVMMSYRAAGIFLPRTSQEQWLWGPGFLLARSSPVTWCSSSGERAPPRRLATWERASAKKNSQSSA